MIEKPLAPAQAGGACNAAENSSAKSITVDILIIGGGLIGAALMLALMNRGYEVLLLDANPLGNAKSPAHFDARTLALSSSSIRILTELQVWPLLVADACPIKTVHVSQQGSFGISHLKADPDDSLGAVIELPHISHALQQLIPTENILAPAQLIALDTANQIATVKHEAGEIQIKAQLFVAADGGQSTARRGSSLPVKIKLYNQLAVVANIGLQRAHADCAYERFTRNGSVAMLPMTARRAALVWCLPPDEAKRLQSLEPALFLKELQLTFGYRLGRLVKVGQRSLFPLQEIIMPTQIDWPLVFIGNAAHTLHPAAGQGFNLGLRDVATLAQCILQHGLNAAMLKEYQTLRQADQTAIIGFTDGLVRTFSSRLPGMALSRGLGLLALDNAQLLQTLLVRYARGYGGDVPDLVCGIPLMNDFLNSEDNS